MREADEDLGLAPNQTHTPSLISPPESKTPPTQRAKRNLTSGGAHGNGTSSEAVDATALSRALERFEAAGRREHTPTGSPSRKRQRVYGDRSVGHEA